MFYLYKYIISHMNYFKNIQDKNDILTFELHCNNRIKKGLNNALRRIVISQIPIIAIDIVNTTFLKNTSVVHNEILLNRLALIPWNYFALKKLDLSQVEVRCRENNPKEEIRDILVQDFELWNGKTKLSLKDYTNFEDILFLKLKTSQEIEFICKFKESIQKIDGAVFCPTSVAIATFLHDEKSFKSALKEIPPEQHKDFTIENQERFYLKDSDGEPTAYKWTIESVGQIPNKDIFKIAMDVLITQLDNLVKAIMEKNIEKIKIEPSKISMIAYDFTISQEDDTLGNLLQTYLLFDPATSYAAYEVIHPLERNVIIRVATTENNTLENNKTVFIKTITEIKKLIMELKKSFK
jgi:DNA-directed RNA polymerase subunit L